MGPCGCTFSEHRLADYKRAVTGLYDDEMKLKCNCPDCQGLLIHFTINSITFGDIEVRTEELWNRKTK